MNPVIKAFALVLLGGLVCCGGPAFRAAELDGVAGAASGGSSEAGTSSVISAGGAIDPVGGSGGVAGMPLPGNEGGNGGELSNAGGGASSGGASSSAGAAGAAGSSSCVAGWAGSSCDTCTHAAGRDASFCPRILDCFAANHCGPGTCFALCESDTPLSSEQVAAAVYACRCKP